MNSHYGSATHVGRTFARIAVQESPALTAAESWLSTVVSSVLRAVSKIIRIANRDGVHPVQLDRVMAKVVVCRRPCGRPADLRMNELGGGDRSYS
jgi:hypothetical protein